MNKLIAGISVVLIGCTFILFRLCVILWINLSLTAERVFSEEQKASLLSTGEGIQEGSILVMVFAIILVVLFFIKNERRVK